MNGAEKPRAGSFFLAAQHQLRQPLNALSLLMGELRQAGEGRDREAILDDMRYALELSNAWLDSLTDLEKAERGQLRLQKQAVSLQPVFARLRDEFRPHFSHLGLDFRIVCSRAVVQADPAVLRRLLSLLLDNAAKFTRDGRVLLGCRRAGDRLRIEVWDTGLGVAETEHARLFEPFFRLENEVRPRERGLGLGLAYAKRLVELAGDELTVASRLGQGSCFALSLPLVGAARETAARDAKVPRARPARQSADAEFGGEFGGVFGLRDGKRAPSPDLGPISDPMANPLVGKTVLLLENAETGTLCAHLEEWGATTRTVPADRLAAGLAERPAVVIAEREAFASAEGWEALRRNGEGPVTILIARDAEAAKAAAAADPEGRAHYLTSPVKPARLRALCHFALSQA